MPRAKRDRQMVYVDQKVLNKMHDTAEQIAANRGLPFVRISKQGLVDAAMRKYLRHMEHETGRAVKGQIAEA